MNNLRMVKRIKLFLFPVTYQIKRIHKSEKLFNNKIVVIVLDTVCLKY